MIQSIKTILKQLDNAVDSDDVIIIGEKILNKYNNSDMVKIKLTLNKLMRKRIASGLDHWHYLYLINYIAD